MSAKTERAEEFNVSWNYVADNLKSAATTAQKRIVLLANMLNQTEFSLRVLDQYESGTRILIENALKALDVLQFAPSEYRSSTTGILDDGHSDYLVLPPQPRTAQQIIDEIVSEHYCNSASITWEDARKYIEVHLNSKGASSNAVALILQALPKTLDDPSPKCLSVDFDLPLTGPETRILFGDREWFFDARTGKPNLYETKTARA